MNPGDEVMTATTDVTTPAPGAADTDVYAALDEQTPLEVARPGTARPSPEDVLGWVAAARGPWFPSAHARDFGVRREALDGPLDELREAGLVAVADWVRGLGQGYELTPEGSSIRDEAAADEPAADPNLTPPLPEPVGIDPRPPVVTPAVLLANVLWFFAGLVLAYRAGVSAKAYLAGKSFAALDRFGAVTAPELLRGEWWRLGTSCFVHVGLFHLALNLVAIAMMGPLAERLWGRWRLLTIYAVSGLAGGCLAMAAHPTGPNGQPVLLAGASGAIWGVMTSLAAWLLLFYRELDPALASDWARRLGRLFLLNVGINLLAVTDVLAGVSWEAHLGGGVAGFVAAGLLNAARYGNWWRRPAAAVLLALLPVGCVGGLAWAMRSGDPWAPVRRQAAAEEAFRQAVAYAAQLQAAEAAFNREVAPLLPAVTPDKARAVEDRAGPVLLGSRRGAARAEVRAQAVGLRAAAAEVAGKAGEPAGVEPVDRVRAKVAAYADARVRSLDRLLGLLDAEAVPDPAAVKEWKAGCREADRLWAEAGRP